MVPFLFTKRIGSVHAPSFHETRGAGLNYCLRSSAMLCAVFAAIAFMTACTPKRDVTVIRGTEGKQYHFKNSETLRVPVETEPPTIDWNKISDTTSAGVVMNIMAGLVQFDLSDPNLKLVPSLAKSWREEDGARRWVFDLREDAEWTDGVKLTPQHIVDGFERLLDPKTASEVPDYLFPVKNARDFNSGKKLWTEVGVHITGEHQVTVELEKPLAYFPMIVANCATFPVRKDLIEKYGDKWVEPKNLVTIGPFILRDWAHDKALIFDSNPKFYEGEPKVKHIVTYVIGEPQTSISLFNAGDLDAVYHLPSVQLKLLRSRPEYHEISTEILSYYGMNVTKAPLNNLHLRRAIIQAFDRSQIVKIMNGGETAMSGWVPPGILGYDPTTGFQFNVEQAKHELALAVKELGYKSVDEIPRIMFRFNTNEDHQKMAENFQSQLLHNLGLRIELKNEEWKVYLSALKNDPPQIFRFGWAADYPDPDNFMSQMTSNNEGNRTRWKNPEYDRLVNVAASETDSFTRVKLYRTAQQLLTHDDAVVIPLYANVTHMLVSQRVLHPPIDHLDAYEYKHVEIKP